jgi:hypothetical protein
VPFAYFFKLALFFSFTDFIALTMPPRKRKVIDQVQPKAKKMKQQSRQDTLEERNRRLAMLRETASETVQ